MAIRRIEAPAVPWTSERSANANMNGLSRFAFAIARHFANVESLLDVGAGAGRLREVLVGGSRVLYVGVDQSENPGIVRADAHDLPFQDGTFDVVASKQTLPHFVDPSRAIAEMRRVARRGVIIQQEFPSDGVGWDGHSRVHIDSPDDVLALLPGATFDGIDFVWRAKA